ncbi:MAG: helix-turn-helix domain-containing protein [Gammaproteobacteria bacterium]
MTQSSRLYERAAVNKEFDALWDIRDGRTFFTGPLYRCASHQHGAPVFLASLYGKFHLRLHGGDWLRCRTAIIPAGVVHELEVGGEPITVLYIEPTVAGADAFKPLVTNSRALNGALIGNGGEITFLRDLYESRYQSDWTAEALQDLLGYANCRAQTSAIDPRLQRIVEHLHIHGDDLTPLAALTAQVGLSPSRFQHLFTEQIGVPYRRYRAWNRMRQALGEIVRGQNFTAAAHAAGFTDSAHFCHDFRKIFGAPPSVSLRRLARLQT